MKTAAIALLIAAAAAQPHGHGMKHKHDARAVVIEVVTKTETVTEYMDLTTTSWVGAASTPTDSFSEQPANSPPAPPAVVTAVPPPPPAAAPLPITTSSVYIALAPAAPSPVAPVYSSAPAPAAPVAPVAPVAPAAPAAPKSSSGGGGGGGQFNGDITFYDVGLGACGEDDSGKGNSDNIVALSKDFPAATWSSLCGKSITIYASNGKSATATVRDKCMGCKPDDIDVSSKVFNDLFGGPDVGRTTVSWSLN